jgi:cytochrome P450
MPTSHAAAEPAVSPALPPGPPPANTFVRRLRHYASMVVDPVGTVARRFDRYGDIYRVQFADNALYVLRHPDHIRDVLVNQASVFGKGHSAFARLGDVLGDSLLTSEGDDWRRQRRLVQPAFAQARLVEYAEVMVDEAARSATELSRANGRTQDLSAAMTSLTLRIVARTLFGQRADDSPRITRAMSWLNQSFGSPELLPRGVPTPARRRMQRAVVELDATVYDVIARRSQQLAQGGEKPRDLLQRLLDARDAEGDGQGLSPKEVRDQLVTLYLAGHDTTSHALSWTFYLLSQNPAAQQALDAELARVLGARLPRFEDLPALPYTEQAIQEAMRIYPPVMAIPRRAQRDATIGPYPVPAGSEVIIWVYRTHHDPRFFPAPERFEPERFDEAHSVARPKHAYLPFGAGQRACIGQTFAMVEAQLIVATFAQRLRLRHAGKRAPGMRMGVTLAPKGGLPMQISARSGSR